MSKRCSTAKTANADVHPLTQIKEPTMPNCPLCEKPLEKVRRSTSSPLNEDQFDAVKAGDWFCDCSDNGRGNAPFAYFWNRELESGLLAR